MPLDRKPQVAQQVASIGESGAAVISYSVPLPSSHHGRRLVELDLGFADEDWQQEAKDAGVDVAKEVVLSKEKGTDTRTFDTIAAAQLFRESLGASGATRLELATVDEAIATLRRSSSQAALRDPEAVRNVILNVPQSGVEGRVQPPMIDLQTNILLSLRQPALPGGEFLHDGDIAGTTVQTAPTAGLQEPGTRPPTLPPLPGVPQLADMIAALSRGQIMLPVKRWSGHIDLVPVKQPAKRQPRLYLIEIYGITSIPSNFGLGKAIRTFTLFPGERAELSVRTWRTSRRQTEESKSIIDSFSSTAADRFSAILERENGFAAGDQSSETHDLNWNAGGGLNLGFISIGGGGAGSSSTLTQSSRQIFAQSTQQALSEHARVANNERQTAVSLNSEQVDESGEESSTTRVVRNVNMRRTLNFVFRELNQEYRTAVHLIDVRIGFENGLQGSWRECSLPELGPFLSRLIVAKQVDAVAKKILRLVGTVPDHGDQPVRTLELLRFAQNGDWEVEGAKPDAQGDYAAPDDLTVYRFERGPLRREKNKGKNGEAREFEQELEGVVISVDSVVMRTESVIAEALLGQADALDSYALSKQAADAERASLANRREDTALDLLEAIANPQERAAAFARMFNDEEVHELVFAEREAGADNGDDDGNGAPRPL